MPKLESIRGLSLCIFHNDHEPAHFHIRGRGVLVKIEIESGEIVFNNGVVSKSVLNEANDWLESNRERLMAVWHLAYAGEKFEWDS